jgi:peptidoglycan/xylan/chitin deacetylase (PgdA/CDA1 family)
LSLVSARSLSRGLASLSTISGQAVSYITRLASKRRGENLLTIFIFHKVQEIKNPFYPDIPAYHEFSRILDWISEQFNILSLANAIDMLKSQNLPERAAAITFDDGNGETLTCTSPLFNEKRIPATFFINTAYLGGGEPFFERIFRALELTACKALDLSHIGEGVIPLLSPQSKRAAADHLCEKAKYLMPCEADLFSQQIVEAARHDGNVRMVSFDDIINKGCEWIDFGAHSHNHSILTTLDGKTAAAEISECKRIITELTGNKTPLFAYPNGKPGIDFTPEHEAMVRHAGFCAALSTATGAASKNTNLYNLPRFTPWDNKKTMFQLRMITNLLKTSATIDISK